MRLCDGGDDEDGEKGVTTTGCQMHGPVMKHDTRAILDTIEDTGVKVAWSETADAQAGTIFTAIRALAWLSHAGGVMLKSPIGDKLSTMSEVWV